MHRFFTGETLCAGPGEFFSLTGSDAHHIRNVLRMRVSDEITVCDAHGDLYFCKISSFSGDNGQEVTLSVVSCEKNTKAARRITLFQGFVKGDKMDLIVQKASELGVSDVIPVYMKHCVSVPDASSAAKKTERWSRIAYEASKQSKRSVPSRVLAPLSFTDAVKRMKESSLFFCCHENAKKPIRSFFEEERMSGRFADGADISFIIGPEGGFSSEETELLISSGVPTVSLGDHILRTETAPIAALSMICYEDMR